jgi:hypothetical protein
MKRATIFATALVLTGLAIAGVATAQDDGGSTGSTDEVTFYGHVFGHGLPSPQAANTEAPVGEDNYGLGSFEWCTDQAWATSALSAGTGGCEESPFNRLALFSTAGFVDVQSMSEFNQEGGYGLLHNERGQTKDIKLDTSGSVTANVYGTVDVHGWPVSGQPYGTNCIYAHAPGVPCVYPYWGWDPGVQPNFVVQATLWQADLGDRSTSSEAPPVQDAIQSGDAEPIAQGQWGPEPAMTGLPGSPNAMEFEIDLGNPQTDTISKENDFFLTYRVYSDSPASDVGLHTFRWWAGEFFPPSFDMPVENAFAVERVIPNFANGKLAMLGIINTPWGSYDVDDESVDVEIEGPDGNTIEPDNLDRFADFSVAHGGHYDPVNVTWIWDYRADEPEPGEYTVTVSGSNFQGSATASCKAKFTLEEEGGTLRPGGVQEGVCGQQTASQQFVEQVQEGAEQQTGGN